MKLKLVFISLLGFTSFFSCKNDDTSCKTIFVGGEIINPTSKYILLKKGNNSIDSILLDEKNTFSKVIEHFEPGLYQFFYGGEYQDILLQNGDSIRLRLNTLDFDESLVYTGKGAKENNFLMELFLLNHKENNSILKLSQKDPETFENDFSTLRDKKLNRLKDFKLKNNTSILFNEIAEGSINYEYYSLKELYPLANYNLSELNAFKSLPENFYDYRKNIDYNNINLKDYMPYLSFLRFHFSNLALKKHFSHSKDSVYNRLDVHYNLDKLDIINEKIKDEDLKNRLLNYVATHFINISKNTDDYDKILESFKSKSTNKKNIEYVTRYVNSYKRLKTGNTIPKVQLLNKNNDDVNINKLINKPTVLYFWTKHNKNHLISSHKRIKELNVKYPEVNFIAINIDAISYKEQERLLKHYDVRIHNEYRFKHPKKAKETLFIKPILKVFLLNKNGKIENAKANIWSIRFEQELLGVINQ